MLQSKHDISLKINVFPPCREDRLQLVALRLLGPFLGLPPRQLDGVIRAVEGVTLHFPLTSWEYFDQS